MSFGKLRMVELQKIEFFFGPGSPFRGRGYTLLVDIGTQTGLPATERNTIKFVCAAPRWLDG